MDAVLWIREATAVGFAILLCPRSGRHLLADLFRIRQLHVQTVVSLLEKDEATMLGVGDERQQAESIGLRFVSFPIPDAHVPPDAAAFRVFVSGLAARLEAGEPIGVHCRGSIGRSTVVAACTLIHMGWKPEDALAAVEAARGCPVPGTEEQRRWILNYKARQS